MIRLLFTVEPPPETNGLRDQHARGMPGTCAQNEKVAMALLYYSPPAPCFNIERFDGIVT
jgi:hypothetical protein